MKPTFTFSLKNFLTVFLILGAGSHLKAQVTVDAVSTAATGAGVNATSLTWAHTTAGTNRLLVVTCAADGGTVHTTNLITYNGVALTKADAITGGESTRSEIWYLVNPPVGTYNIVWSHSASEGLVGYGISFNGVDQTTPVGTALTGNNGNVAATSSTLSPTAADGDMVIDVISTDDVAVTVGSSQTQRNNVGANGFVAGGTSTRLEQCPGTTTSMTWTFASDNYAHVAVSVKAISTIAASTLTTSNAGADQNACGSTTATLAGNAVAAGETGLWTLTSGGGSITTNNSPTSGVTALTATPGVFRWTITNAVGCTSSDEVTITRGNTIAGGTASVSTTSVCTGGTVSLSLASETTAGCTRQWQQSTNGGAWANIGTGVDPQTTGALTNPNSYQFRCIVTETASGCTATSTTSSTVSPSAAATVAAAGPDQIICSGNKAICAPLSTATGIMAGNSVGAGETGAWTRTSGSGSITTSSDPATAVSTLSSGVFRWTITNGACTSFDEVTITQDDTYALIAGTATAAPTSPCTGGVALLGITGEYATSVQWQQNVNGGGWTDIGGATSAAYTTGALTNPNSYQYRVKFHTPAPCVNYTYSNTVTVTPVTIPAAGAATNYTFTSRSLTLSTPMGSCAATYTFDQTVPNTSGYINAGVTVTISGFITGTDATTMSSGSCGGVAINMATVVKTATSVTFTTPAALCGNFSIVLSGITNAPYDSGSGTVTVSVGNRSGGTDSGTYPYDIAYHPGDYYDYDAAGSEDYATQNGLSHCYNNLSVGVHCFSYINPPSGSVTIGTIANQGTSACNPSNGGFATVPDITSANVETGKTSQQQLYVNSTCESYPGVATAAGSCLTPGATYTVCFTVPAGCSGQNFCPLVDCGTGNCGNLALPIELLFFDARLNGNVVLLHWTTATEINNDYFTIERTMDGKIYFEVAKVSGAGNSNSILQYNTVDIHPFKGRSYYRLKQTDYDGKYAYSKMVAVDLLSSSELKLKYAVSNKEYQNLQYQFDYSGQRPLSVDIVNVLGESILTQELDPTDGGQVLNVNISGLSRGMYILKVSDGINSEMKKFVY